jgi:hypothetical protein
VHIIYTHINDFYFFQFYDVASLNNAPKKSQIFKVLFSNYVLSITFPSLYLFYKILSLSRVENNSKFGLTLIMSPLLLSYKSSFLFQNVGHSNDTLCMCKIARALLFYMKQTRSCCGRAHVGVLVQPFFFFSKKFF